jgi:hypothetical protein
MYPGRPTELVKKKISIIMLLENLLKNKLTKEVEIHKILENNLWLLDNNYDLVLSNQTLSEYVGENIKIDPELNKRPDLIVKVVLQDPSHIILIELKRPSVKLTANHLGQVLGYKGIIQNHNHEIRIIDTFLIGYEKDPNFPRDLSDIKVELLEDLIIKKRREFNEFLAIIEKSNEEGEL